LPGANADLVYNESQDRVIALINAMKEKIGSKFPSSNGKPIPGGWLIVEGEPASDAAGEATRGLSGAGAFSGATADFAAEPGKDEAEPASPELYEELAATMNAQVLPELVNAKLFDSLTGKGVDLKGVRGEFGGNLWVEWASGWQASFDLPDLEERERVQGELEQIAGRLRKAGVNMDDTSGVHTPLVECARANESEAVRKLHAMGADLNLRDRSGYTPLTMAAFHGARETVRYLLKAGANRRTKSGRPAASRSMTPDAEALVEAGMVLPPQTGAEDAARLGRRLAEGNPVRQEEYDATLAALAKGKWPWRLFGN
jgi:hypothetical protein